MAARQVAASTHDSRYIAHREEEACSVLDIRKRQIAKVRVFAASCGMTTAEANTRNIPAGANPAGREND
jgi:hypothetical protein